MNEELNQLKLLAEKHVGKINTKILNVLQTPLYEATKIDDKARLKVGEFF